MHRNSFVARLILALAMGVILMPLTIVVAWSFANRWPWPDLLPLAWSWRGMEEVFASHSQVMDVLLYSIGLSLAVAVIATVIGLLTARALAFYDFWGKDLIIYASMLPIIVPTTVFAMGIHVIFIRQGLAGNLWGVLIGHVIVALPYTVHILRGVTLRIGSELEEQAQVLGASEGQAFYTVSLPLLLPGILSSMAMAYIISFSQYFLTLLIGGGQVKTLSLIMVPFIVSGDRTLASAYALVFLVTILLVFVIMEGLVRLYSRKIISREK